MVTIWVAVACTLVGFVMGVFGSATWYFFKYTLPSWHNQRDIDVRGKVPRPDPHVL